jgi:hypothetical protein
MKTHCLSVLLPVCALASESANYSMTPLTLDGGGRRSASASYKLDSSVASGGAAGAGNYGARTGYAGSLYEVLGLDVSASSLTVSEGGNGQLTASLLLDDASLLTLDPPAVTWSVQSGPLTGVASNGLATAGIVYQNTSASAQGSYQSFTDTVTLTVSNVNADDFGTYAGDGLADDWQVQYFGHNNSLAGPAIDADGDGFDNRFEYNARLVPTDPLSFFSMNIEDAPGGGHAVTFFPRLSGSTYTLLGSSDLSLWAPVSGATIDAGTIRTIIDPAGTGPRRFYSISVQR